MLSSIQPVQPQTSVVITGGSLNDKAIIIKGYVTFASDSLLTFKTNQINFLPYTFNTGSISFYATGTAKNFEIREYLSNYQTTDTNQWTLVKSYDTSFIKGIKPVTDTLTYTVGAMPYTYISFMGKGLAGNRKNVMLLFTATLNREPAPVNLELYMPKSDSTRFLKDGDSSNYIKYRDTIALNHSIDVKDSILNAKINANAHHDSALTDLKISKSDSNTYKPCYYYVVKMTQTSTSNPVITTIFNNYSSNISCVRSTNGTYNLINTDSTFTPNKVFITAFNANGTQDSVYMNRWVKLTHSTNALIIMNSYINGTLADGVLTEFYLKLELWK